MKNTLSFICVMFVFAPSRWVRVALSRVGGKGGGQERGQRVGSAREGHALEHGGKENAAWRGGRHRECLPPY